MQTLKLSSNYNLILKDAMFIAEKNGKTIISDLVSKHAKSEIQDAMRMIWLEKKGNKNEIKLTHDNDSGRIALKRIVDKKKCFAELILYIKVGSEWDGTTYETVKFRLSLYQSNLILRGMNMEGVGMSLTSILKTKPKEFEPFVSAIHNIDVNYPYFFNIKESNSISAPYRLKNFKKAALVGTAFDYIARWMVARKITENKTASIENLVAGHGLRYLLQKRNADNKEKVDKISQFYKMGIEIIKDYIIGIDVPIETLCNIAIFFGKLEVIYRSGKIEDPSFYLVKEVLNVQNELKEIVKVFEETFLNTVVKEYSKVAFNPKFGNGSMIVGGADADIIIDGVLYDFKTTKNREYNEMDTYQLLGYYILNEFDGTHSIKALSIYKARYGIFEELPIGALDRDSLKGNLKNSTDFLNSAMGL